MHLGIKWLALKYHHCVTSISGNRFVNWLVWHYIGMEWNEFFVPTKVGFYCSQLNNFRKKIIKIPFLVLSLQELCCRTIVRRTSVYAIDTLPLPPSVKKHLKSYALTSSQCINTLTNTKKGRCKTPTQSSTRNSCSISWSVYAVWFSFVFVFFIGISQISNKNQNRKMKKKLIFFWLLFEILPPVQFNWMGVKVGQYRFKFPYN